jgi:hypothetical protein
MLNLHPVGAGVGKPRVAEAVLDLAVVGKQHEPFAVAIEPTHWVHIRN